MAGELSPAAILVFLAGELHSPAAILVLLAGELHSPATILAQCSAEMLKLYYSADVIIAKGQGNYESLDEEPGNIFFLLRAKCPVVAKLLGVNTGDAILKQHHRSFQVKTVYHQKEGR